MPYNATLSPNPVNPVINPPLYIPHSTLYTLPIRFNITRASDLKFFDAQVESSLVRYWISACRKTAQIVRTMEGGREMIDLPEGLNFINHFRAPQSGLLSFPWFYLIWSLFCTTEFHGKVLGQEVIYEVYLRDLLIALRPYHQCCRFEQFLPTSLDLTLIGFTSTSAKTSKR